MSDIEGAKAHFLAALDLLDAKDFAGAEPRLRAALAIVPDRVSVLTNLAIALLNQEKLAEACEVARRSVAAGPHAYEGWLALGSVLTKLGRLDEALAAMERAVKAEPNARSLMGRAHVHSEAKRFDLAVADYSAAWKLDPDEEFVLGLLIGSQTQACDWTDLHRRIGELLAGVRAGRNLVNHSTFLAVPGATAADQLASARTIAARDFPAAPASRHTERRLHERIRIAYVSGDFRWHALAHLIVGVFEHHDRTRFETFGVSYGPDDGSDLRSRIAGSLNHFVDVRGESDGAIAAHIKANEVDIAIDLGGFTDGGRPRVFAQQPAPLQVNYLGYPGTFGSSAIDYLIADAVIVPPEAHQFYSERIVSLPESYQANDDKDGFVAKTPTRAAVGLPESGFVFCSFNANYKITPSVFDIWMDLLCTVEDSVLWLLLSNPVAAGNLRRAAEARGVAARRLVFAPVVPIPQHLARNRLADLFLDTMPCNAHTTASDALRMGLPVVTCIGATFAGRVGASLLRAIGMSELVTSSFDEYRQLGLALARDPARLAAIRAKLAANRDTTPLFDTARLTRHLESAYTTMVERHRRGEAPAAFAVDAIE